MNFYKHHLGDYDGHTAHLSWDEDLAYTRLMRAYYRLEKPLPLDLVAINRLVRAHSKAHREAVDRVLAEFFDQQADGWHNKRCDEEIAAYQAQAATNRRIARQRFVNDSSTKGPPATLSEREPNHKPEPEANNQKEKEHGSRKNGAHHASIDLGPVVQTLPLVDGSDFEVRQSLVAELEPLYPQVDIAATVNEMKGWLIGNRERRKTRRGIKSFITRWLHNEQQKATA